MSPEKLQALLVAVAAGELTVDQAMVRLKGFPVDSVVGEGGIIGRLDSARELRHGFPEVILAQGKSFDHLREIVGRALSHGRNLLITRVSPRRGARLLALYPELLHAKAAHALYCQRLEPESEGMIGIFSAGTSDIRVAEEAALTARLMGARVETHYDAGVAGLHRLLAAGELLQRARVFIVVAGMEGALPSVVGGLVDKPVIAVPTAQGYGAAFHGLSALLGMLNSCAANVTVVNIDNGFGAGYVAALINRQKFV